MVWFVLGVLIGSLFVVWAHPLQDDQQYANPSVETFNGANYTAHLFYTRNGLPIDGESLAKKIELLVDKGAPNTGLHAYAVPNLPDGVVLLGYGIKVMKNGRTETYIIAAKKGATPGKNVRMKLLRWAKEKPNFAGKISMGTYGPFEGWKVKLSSNTGKEKTAVEAVSPYWYDIGPAEIQLTYPPYGDIYMRFHLYIMFHDGDPQWDYFLLAPGRDGDGKYEIDPGYGQKAMGISNYGDYVTFSAMILHDWNLDPALDPHIETAEPLENGENQKDREVQITIGVQPSLTFTAVFPSSYMFPSVARSTQKAAWLLEFAGSAADSRYSFKTNVASWAKVKQSALRDGRWHPIVKAKFQANFIEKDEYKQTHTGSEILTWYVKVG